MYVFVSLPLDIANVEEDVLLANIRKGLGSCGRNCDMFFLPPLEIASIDSLFDAEERVSRVEALLKGLAQSYFSIYSEISSGSLSSRAVLGKTFDHFIKSFTWRADIYSSSSKVLNILASIEEASASLSEQFKEKNRQYAEDRKKASMYFADNSSIYTADISAVAYNGDFSSPSPFLSKYYIGIRNSLKEKDIKQLDQAKGIFVESIKLVLKCHDGGIYEILGQSKSPEKIRKEIEGLGHCIKVPMESLEQYKQHLLDGEEARSNLASTEKKFLAMMHGTAQKLILLLLHANYLSLYIESILRFGLPSSFVFCVVETSSTDKILSKWKKITQSWKYSTRMFRPNRSPAVREAEKIYEFVYRILESYDSFKLEKSLVLK